MTMRLAALCLYFWIAFDAQAALPPPIEDHWYSVLDRRPCFQNEQDQRTQELCNLRIYQIMVESFYDGSSLYDYGVGSGPSKHKGDLEGVIQALPYIKGLGANAIWLTPIFDPGFSDDQWLWAKRRSATGYFARNYFGIAPNLGNLALAKTLVQKAHDLGLYVFLDGVFGHHKESGVLPSPRGNRPSGSSYGVSYPASLEFYKEVASYWINELEIDGWRLDVANEVPLDAWRSIRKAVEQLCAERKLAGKQWGTLGYMVAEVWKDEQTIQNSVIGPSSQPALQSAFNFSSRYALVKVLATQEWVDQKGSSAQPASLLAYQEDRNEQVYADHAMPNFMIGNHDLVRFGDLIQRAGYPGPEDSSYWKRHQAAFSFLAVQSGPVTIYYNEELGSEVPGFAQKVSSNCEDLGLCDDHVARSDALIPGLANFSPKANQQKLLGEVKAMLTLRNKHPAMHRGQRRHLYSDHDLYLDIKIQGNDRILYALNTSQNKRQLFIPQEILDESGQSLPSLLPGESIAASKDGYYEVNLEGLSGQFYEVGGAQLSLPMARIYVDKAFLPEGLIRYRRPQTAFKVPDRALTPAANSLFLFGEIPLGSMPEAEICIRKTLAQDCANGQLYKLSEGDWTLRSTGLSRGRP